MRVLITGGTGSLGLAIASKLPKALLMTNNELELVEAQRLGFNAVFGDIRDADCVCRAMRGIDTVIHAAALKHIPVCEDYPTEAVKTNILGSINVIDAARDNVVKKVIAISSDKAVNPINLYGGTKLVMEKLFIQANFSCIRFGNFQGSAGSVLPLWRKQMEEGKEITVTDKEMTRFWITLDKAAEFVLQCIDMMKGGEIYIPKMPRVELSELIQSVAPDAKIKVIGIRRGEKLHELLFNEGEFPIDCGDYYLIKGA